MVRIGAINGLAGEGAFWSVCTVNNVAYFGTYTSQAVVVAVDLTTFARIGAVSANSGEDTFGQPFVILLIIKSHSLQVKYLLEKSSSLV